MDIYSETEQGVVSKVMEQLISPKVWWLLRDEENLKGLYRKLENEGYMDNLGNGNYRMNF